MPEVTTYSPWLACAPAGRYWRIRLAGSPTFGCTTPVALLVPTLAETPIEGFVISSTIAPSDATVWTFPTSPSPLITGSLTWMPELEPASIETVWYQMFGVLTITSAVTGR